jgi:hypothetical protein|tara:strand:- start:3849 stop:4118 length:270 start_codon:yes stop_codon:yes gene_type:complete
VVNPEDIIRQSVNEDWVLKAVRSLSGKQAISLRTRLAKKGTLNSLPKSIVGELHMIAAPMDSPPGIPKHDVVGISGEEFNALAQKLGVG